MVFCLVAWYRGSWRTLQLTTYYVLVSCTWYGLGEGGGLVRGQEVKVYPIIGQSIDVLAMASVVCYYHLYM